MPRHCIQGPGPGRPKGCKNKFTNLKENFMNVLERLGGEEWIFDHAQNKKQLGNKDFFQALARLLPTYQRTDTQVQHNVIIQEINPGKIEKKKDG